MRVFKSKGVMRFTRRERITDSRLNAAIQRIELGGMNADLGGGLIKLRIPRPGQGSSGGFRMLVAYREADRAVFLYGFAKNERDNISHDQQQALRIIGANWLSATADTLERAICAGDLQEIAYDDTKAQPPGS